MVNHCNHHWIPSPWFTLKCCCHRTPEDILHDNILHDIHHDIVWLVLWKICFFQKSWDFQNPNWGTDFFFRGVRWNSTANKTNGAPAVMWTLVCTNIEIVGVVVRYIYHKPSWKSSCEHTNFAFTSWGTTPSGALIMFATTSLKML